MTTNEKDNEIPGFRNYDKFLEGYSVFSDYFTDRMKDIVGGKHNENELPDETKEKFLPIVKALIKGAVALQFVGDKDLYHNGEDMEILIKFKKEYKSLTLDKIEFDLMKDVILALEQEKHQFERIATSCKGN